MPALAIDTAGGQSTFNMQLLLCAQTTLFLCNIAERAVMGPAPDCMDLAKHKAPASAQVQGLPHLQLGKLISTSSVVLV